MYMRGKSEIRRQMTADGVGRKDGQCLVHPQEDFVGGSAQEGVGE